LTRHVLASAVTSDHEQTASVQVRGTIRHPLSCSGTGPNVLVSGRSGVRVPSPAPNVSPGESTFPRPPHGCRRVADRSRIDHERPSGGLLGIGVPPVGGSVVGGRMAAKRSSRRPCRRPQHLLNRSVQQNGGRGLACSSQPTTPSCTRPMPSTAEGAILELSREHSGFTCLRKPFRSVPAGGRLHCAGARAPEPPAFGTP
jgi:hypothetical protein